MKPTVCVAMSGGVDSSVAAALLVEQGYNVVGAFMKNWSLAGEGVLYKPWEDEAADARAVCTQLNIPFHIFDFEQPYRERVVKRFVAEYKRGRTPNPDVLCNREIKFDLFMKSASALGAQAIATGHYARVKHANGQYQLWAGTDIDKDQSYFLYTLTGEQLSKVIFPIGHLLKSRVRELAHQHHLVVADKKDSQGICFIGPVSMRKFLQSYIKSNPGDVITTDGRVIGKHDGVIYYTEGQRHGFDTGGSHEPLYVVNKNVEDNELMVAPAGDVRLLTKSVALEEVTWINGVPDLSRPVLARVRYRQTLHNATVEHRDGAYFVIFDQPIEHVSLGQSAVLYDGVIVLGGGIIAQKFN